MCIAREIDDDRAEKRRKMPKLIPVIVYIASSPISGRRMRTGWLRLRRSAGALRWWRLQKQKAPPTGCFLLLEAPPGIGPGMKVLQTSALPLGYGAKRIAYYTMLSPPCQAETAGFRLEKFFKEFANSY